MTILEDSRTASMLTWLKEELQLDFQDFSPASSDASFRRYYRIRNGQTSFVVMDAPPERENIEPFLKVAELLRNSDVHVPKVYAQNLHEGFLLLEDFGTVCYLDVLDSSTIDSLYQSALDSLFNIQTKTDIQDNQLPKYDHAFFTRELKIFEDWFINKFLDMEMPEPITTHLHAILIESALEQPVTCVHRDFHSRNLMVLEQDGPGVIDFQDAVIGPITYDLASLLRDCYINWPDMEVERWMQNYFYRISNNHRVASNIDQFRRWFDLMGMQRHLKAIGIFARLHLRDQKSNYLMDIPRTLDYVIAVSRKYPELALFDDFCHNHILPKYRAVT